MDDTIIIQSAKYPTELCESLVYQLTPMSTWFFNNKFSVNTSKTEVIFFGKPDRVETCKNTEPVTFQGSTIDCTNKVKYLGIVFDEGMTWENQSNEARKNAYFNLIKIKKIVSFLDNRTKHLLLNTLVFPHINYCLSSWSTASKKCIKKFDSLLRNVDMYSLLERNLQIYGKLPLLLQQSTTCAQRT